MGQFTQLLFLDPAGKADFPAAELVFSLNSKPKQKIFSCFSLLHAFPFCKFRNAFKRFLKVFVLWNGGLGCFHYFLSSLFHFGRFKTNILIPLLWVLSWGTHQNKWYSHQATKFTISFIYRICIVLCKSVSNNQRHLWTWKDSNREC